MFKGQVVYEDEKEERVEEQGKEKPGLNFKEEAAEALLVQSWC